MSFITQDWDSLFRGYSALVFPETEGHNAKFVAKQDCTLELRQGDTEEVWVIFEVNGKFYKKFGTQSSYGDITWTGQCVEVEKKLKTIEVFE